MHEWDFYTEMFADVAEQVEANPDGPIEGVTVDASSGTFSVSGVRIRGNQYSNGGVPDDVLLPDVMKATQPDMKLVVMLRDPVTR